MHVGMMSRNRRANLADLSLRGTEALKVPLIFGNNLQAGPDLRGYLWLLHMQFSRVWIATSVHVTSQRDKKSGNL